MRTALRISLLAALLVVPCGAFAATASATGPEFPLPLSAYSGEEGMSLAQVLVSRARAEPLNLVGTLLFLAAVIHTLVAPQIARLAHRLEHRPAADRDGSGTIERDERPLDRRSFRAEMLHFLGEIEAVFGIWVLPLLAILTVARGWHVAESFIGHGVVFTEPMFVVVVMAIASTRPVLQLAERVIGVAARVLGGSPFAWWISILVVGPLLGSFITEPAAMVICALLLVRHLFSLGPTPRLRYATLGLLFVNVSVGGTLTHFAAPPVLMVAGRWGWDLAHMLSAFGWKAALGVVAGTALYALAFRGELAALASRARQHEGGEGRAAVPAWVVATHVGFLAWTVFTAHTPVLFVGGFLFFLAFLQATSPHQNRLELRSPLLVGFFLGGLVVHGTLQQWWIAPVLGALGETPLYFGALGLTAFNDNAAITYLASLVPTFTDPLKYAVVAGAVAGGGLTVIANAPNPAGQAILAPHFDGGIRPTGLLAGAVLPTVIVSAAFLLLP